MGDYSDIHSDTIRKILGEFNDDDGGRINSNNNGYDIGKEQGFVRHDNNK